MGSLWEFIGWGGLTPNEQLAVMYYGALYGAAGLMVYLTLRSLFGGLTLKRTPAKKKRRKPKHTRRGRR